MLEGAERSTSVILYNEREVRHNASIYDAAKGYNVWVDVVNPSPAEMQSLSKTFAINGKALEQWEHKSKKPQIRIFDDQVFTVTLSMGFENARSLSSEAVYAFLGRGWLVTVHEAHNDSIEEARMLFKQNDRRIMASSLDSIYYSIITGIVNSYEQLLTSIELSIASLGQDSLHKPSRRMLEKLDVLSKHIITLRRHFWRTRHIINLLINTKQENREESRQLKVAYDEINQLIDLVESLRDSINSTQNLYLANASLHLNDTMRTLTIFSAILLPLTFMAGLYGMNGIDLNNISNVPAGFALVLGVMAAVTAALFIFFKQKKWIFVRQEYEDDNKGHPTRKQDGASGHM